MPKQARLALCLAMLLAVLASAAAPLQAAEPVPFRVGIAAPSVNMLPLWIGRDAGLFRAYGLTIEIVDTEGGSRGLAELGDGRLEAMMVGLSAVVAANGRGGDFRLIASAANTLSFRFFGARGIASAAALRGKTVGISAAGSESDVAAALALGQLGLARRDVTIIEAGNTLRRLGLIGSGALAATALNEPADAQARREGLPLLVDLKADLPWIFTAVVVRREALLARHQTLKDFLRAYVEALHLALSDGARARAVLASVFGGFPPAVIEAAYEDFRARVPRDALPSPEGTALMLRELPALGIPVADADAGAHVDAGLIAELRREGFFEAMAMRYRVE